MLWQKLFPIASGNLYGDVHGADAKISMFNVCSVSSIPVSVHTDEGNFKDPEELKIYREKASKCVKCQQLMVSLIL